MDFCGMRKWFCHCHEVVVVCLLTLFLQLLYQEVDVNVMVSGPDFFFALSPKRDLVEGC